MEDKLSSNHPGNTLAHCQLIGWQEWCQLPKLKLPAIKAKIDTGAKTSALHATNIETYKRNNHRFVRFIAHPLQGDLRTAIECHAPVVDERRVRSSNGHEENRIVINTTIMMGDSCWNIDITLTDRGLLRYRMLLGRDALKHGLHINCAKRLLLGRYSRAELRRFYQTS